MLLPRNDFGPFQFTPELSLLTDRATIVSRQRSFGRARVARRGGDGKSDDSISREELRLLRASARTK